MQDFEHMRRREEEMRDTNGEFSNLRLIVVASGEMTADRLSSPTISNTESTNTRVFYLGIFSIGCLLGLATWQVLYLRRFFKTKKLID